MARTFRATTQRRKRVWARGFFTGTAPVSGQFRVDLLAPMRGEMAITAGPLLGSTVGRVFIDWAAARLTGASVNTHLFSGVRVGHLSEEPEDVNPSLFPHQDWMHWRKNYMSEGNAGGAVAALHENAWHIDIQAMRKMEELNQTIFATFVGNGVDTYAVSVGSSVMVLLP